MQSFKVRLVMKSLLMLLMMMTTIDAMSLVLLAKEIKMPSKGVGVSQS